MMMARSVKVTEYDPEWGKLYKKETEQIRRILGGNCTAVHHIGSTAVHGLAAKPIIDIMAVVRDISAVDSLAERFAAIGYEAFGENGISGRRFFAKGGDERTHHIHIYEKSSSAEIRRHLAVRDYLRENDREAVRYAELKRWLADQYRDDPDGYCSGKDEFMKDLEAKALLWKKKQRRHEIAVVVGILLGMMLGIALEYLFGITGAGLVMGIAAGATAGHIIGSK